MFQPEETFDHEYYRHRELITTVADPILGDVSVPCLPIKFSDLPPRRPVPAPLLGQHNEAVLGAMLGLDPAEIARLVDAGVLFAATDR